MNYSVKHLVFEGWWSSKSVELRKVNGKNECFDYAKQHISKFTLSNRCRGHRQLLIFAWSYFNRNSRNVAIVLAGVFYKNRRPRQFFWLRLVANIDYLSEWRPWDLWEEGYQPNDRSSKHITNKQSTHRIINDMSKCGVLETLDTLFLHTNNKDNPRVRLPS